MLLGASLIDKNRMNDNDFKRMILEDAKMNKFANEDPIHAEFYINKDVLFVKYKKKELSFVEFWEKVGDDSPNLKKIAWDAVKKLSTRNGFVSPDQFVKNYSGIGDEAGSYLDVDNDGKVTFKPQSVDQNNTMQQPADQQPAAEQPQENTGQENQ